MTNDRNGAESRDAAPEGGTPDANAIRQQLERIVASPDFEGSDRIRRFLRFLVEETLDGRGGRLKGYYIAVELLGRDASFDPLVDPIVRIEAGKVRRALEHYYLTSGADDLVIIEVPKGGYMPVFAPGRCGPAAEAAPDGGAASAPLPTAAPAPIDPSVAVLPFADLTGDPGSACFAEGLAEELIVGLTRFQAVRVAPRIATARFKARAYDPRMVARELGVRFLLEGSVRTEGETARLAVTLTDAHTGMQVWAERYEHGVATADVFASEDEISRRVLASVAGTYGVIGRVLAQQARQRAPDEFAPYEAVLWYYHDYRLRNDPASHPRALAAFRKVVAENPDYPMALAMLAEILVEGYVLNLAERTVLDEALSLCHDAVALDPLCQQAHLALATTSVIRGDIVQARAAAEYALSLNPNAPFLVAAAGWCLFLCGDTDRGLHLITGVSDILAHVPRPVRSAVCLNHIKKGRYAEALDAVGELRAAGVFWGPMLRAATLGYLNRSAEAAAAVDELLALQPKFPRRGRELIARLIKDDALAERIAQGLERAGLKLLS